MRSEDAAGGVSVTTGPAPITPAELDAIEARANAATPGPWSASLLNDWTDATRINGPEFASANELPEPAWDEIGEQDDRAIQKQIHSDALFMSAARSDVPRLAAEVRRLRAEAAKGPLPTSITDDWSTGVVADYPDGAVLVNIQGRCAAKIHPRGDIGEAAEQMRAVFKALGHGLPLLDLFGGCPRGKTCPRCLVVHGPRETEKRIVESLRGGP